MTDEELETLAARFCAADVPRPEWTHAAHLRVGAWHVARFGPAEALPLLRERIRRLNDRNGVPNTPTDGYHETITAAYVLLIAAYLDACPPAVPLGARVTQMLDGPLGRRDVLLDHYTRETLFSPRARAAWVPPDRAPLAWRR
jgi:hypothetical protein